MFLNKDKDGSFHFSFTTEQLGNSLRIAGIACVGMLTLFLLVQTISAIKAYPTVGEGGTNGVQNTISVSGEADLDVSPDITTFSWSVNTDGKTVEEAQSKAADISNKAIDFLRTNGVKDADIKTIGLQTDTKYDNRYVPCPTVIYNTTVVAPTMAPASAPNSGSASGAKMLPPCGSESVPTGFTTYESVQVKVRDIDKNPSKAGELVAGLAKLGAKVSNPESTVENPDAFRNKVREEAIVKARAQADILAQNLGVKLVRVTSFNEDGAYAAPRAYGMGAMAKSSAMDATVPEISAGTNTINSSVTITYEIR